ncbi:uncharacterized protein LOC143578824 [Bidens hawaiensis]|uniref:uncharacterized protein LOC143578824 n=1 Tax=Bidens hawaiensis TaxID=980011 RepID=UPI004049A400
MTTPRLGFTGMWEEMSKHCKLAVNDYLVFQRLQALDVGMEDVDEPVLDIIVPHVQEDNILEVIVRDRLRLPVEFARNNNLDVETDLGLINPNGVDVSTEIAIELNGYIERYRVRHWTNFVRSNGLQIGTLAVFEYNEATHSLILTDVLAQSQRLPLSTISNNTNFIDYQSLPIVTLPYQASGCNLPIISYQDNIQRLSNNTNSYPHSTYSSFNHCVPASRIFDTLQNFSSSTQVLGLQCYKENVSPSTISNVYSSNEMFVFVGSDNNSMEDELERYIINYLKTMLDSKNHLVQAYRMVRDCFEENPQLDLKLRIIGTRQHDARQYNLPSSSEVAALIDGDIGHAVDNRDIIVTKQSGSLKRISELHPSYTPLQYPLFHPFGEEGYQVNILHKNVSSSSTAGRKKVTMREFFAYHIQDRPNKFSTMLNGRCLFQKSLVDKYTMIEAQRLHFIRGKQHELRCDTYQSLRGMQSVGNTDVSTAGQRVILPSSFTGGARYMMQNYLDAMCLCRWFGYPDFFITITCNPNWPEVKRFLKDTTLKSEDRPDILCRLFKVKLVAMIKLVKDKPLFGKVQAVVYTIEFQKRGLPHAHICIFMHPCSKIHNPEDVDKFISAEIPNKDTDPDLYKLVSDHVIHGPCGDANPKCFPVYKRRDNGQYVVKSDIMMDNRTVVPYNKTLLKQFQAHINVDWCNQDGSIKYLFKYINKGPDRATISLVQNNNADNLDPNLDEIKAFYDCRYVSACEATWRIFAFDVHYRTPSVMRLAFHLPGEQHVVYGANEDIEDILNKTTNASSMFTGWFECNKNHDLAKTLTYAEFPTKYVWKKKLRKWEPRLRGFAIGRVHAVSSAFDEAYYLRILLNKVKGPEYFEYIQTVDGVMFESFRDACYKRGLLDDDKEYIEAIEEASHSSTGYYLRNLFATILITYSLSRPHFVWESTWQLLVDGLILNEQQLKNLALLEIENLLISNNSSFRRYQQMPFPDMETISRATNPLMVEELSYDTETMNYEFNNLFDSLTDEQQGVYNEIMSALIDKKGGVYFVYGYSGTGKTYLWKTLSASIRSKGEVVLNVASSDIASLLLEGGRTAHSRFLIPINLTEDSICPVKGNTDVYELLKKTSLIIWDEAPMIHKHAFEALDRTLNDVMHDDSGNSSEAVFGGKVVVFGGDFRQILPVVTNDQGNAGGPNDGQSVIDIPDDLLILNSVDPMGDLITFVYPNILDRFNELTYFQDRALLAPLNEVVQEINECMIAIFPGEEVEYLSSDSLAECEDVSEDFDPHLYSPDLLNGLKMSGMPNHRLVLKVGVPIMLLRNINHKKGLCNGTRLQVSLGRRVIDAKVVSGTNIGYRTLISQVTLTPTDKKLHFRLKRRQFPISLCFAITINKSQDQSLSRVGLYLKDPVFSHGQLYVALSRVKRRDGIKLVILDKESKLTNKTTNVVYKEIFGNVE